MAEREDVIAAFESERAYQDSKWGTVMSSGRQPEVGEIGGDRSLDEYILYIVGYTNKLLDKASTFADPKGKLDFVRKVGGLCWAAMEQHGAPQRAGFPQGSRNLEGALLSEDQGEPITIGFRDGGKLGTVKGHADVYVDEVGEFRWRLVAANGTVIAISCEGYKARGDAMIGLHAVQKMLRRTWTIY